MIGDCTAIYYHSPRWSQGIPQPRLLKLYISNCNYFFCNIKTRTNTMICTKPGACARWGLAIEKHAFYKGVGYKYRFLSLEMWNSWKQFIFVLRSIYMKCVFLSPKSGLAKHVGGARKVSVLCTEIKIAGQFTAEKKITPHIACFSSKRQLLPIFLMCTVHRAGWKRVFACAIAEMCQ